MSARALPSNGIAPKPHFAVSAGGELRAWEAAVLRDRDLPWLRLGQLIAVHEIAC